MDADVIARLEARMERMEAALDRVTAVLDQVQPQFAMVVDIADDWVQHRVGGDQLEARLAGIERATLALTAPKTLDALVSIATLAPQLERVATLAAGFDDHVGMAVDVADEWVQKNVGGEGVDQRIMGGLDAAVRITDPEVLPALARLAERAPKLERMADLAASFDDQVGMAADIADEWVRENVGGDALDARLLALKDAALALTEPEVLRSASVFSEALPRAERALDLLDLLKNDDVVAAVRSLAELSPRLLRTANVAADLDKFIEAVAQSLQEPAEPLGAWGVFRALGDAEVQRGVGRAIHITRHLGRHESLLPTKR